MTWKRCFTKKVLVVLLATVIFSWLLTQFIGAPQVHRAAVATMPITPSFTEISRATPQHVTGPIYYCSAVAYAPFLVRADYGWHAGGETGDGASAFYLWIFGLTFRLHEFGHWMS